MAVVNIYVQCKSPAVPKCIMNRYLNNVLYKYRMVFRTFVVFLPLSEVFFVSVLLEGIEMYVNSKSCVSLSEVIIIKFIIFSQQPRIPITCMVRTCGNSTFPLAMASINTGICPKWDKLVVSSVVCCIIEQYCDHLRVMVQW